MRYEDFIKDKQLRLGDLFFLEEGLNKGEVVKIIGLSKIEGPDQMAIITKNLGWRIDRSPVNLKKYIISPYVRNNTTAWAMYREYQVNPIPTFPYKYA